MGSTTGKAKGLADTIMEFFLKNKALFLMLIFGIFSQIITKGNFMSAGNLMSVSRQIAVSTIISVGFTVILASGQMDLSVGSMMSMVGICYGFLSKVLPFPVAILATLLVGAISGFANGFMIRVFKLPAFVLTLAMSQVFKGLSYLLCDGKSVGGLSD
ncbi:MAG: ABC transporter permease, partial [Spirochaetaceae bacterium]|nr:ABC transporter permease [Spirochaetaceae bacterium]